MDGLIEVVNKLQDVLYAAGCNQIQLPQIVAVGAQSSGKSSIIESIVGKDFLPRGPGIVTRRPLILQLTNTKKEGEDDCPDEVQFFHSGDRIFYDFDEVRTEIEEETERLAGSNKAIIQAPIIMKLFSTRVVNLTLVDLPGITKIPVGDQPSDIENKLDEIIMSYIKSDSSIILAITAANQDFATSDSLKMARQVDPEGERTLAVVTKLDLMDYGTDATDLLLGKVVPVKLGIVGVVNRSNQDTLNRKSIAAALQDEADFLKRNYPSLCECNGTPYLTKTLNRLLMQHIKDNLPHLRSQILLKIAEHQQMLDLYGKPVIDKPQTLLQVITRFSSSYVATVEGTARNIETSELCGGARICYIFHETFRKALERINPTKNLRKVDILTAIRNATGPRPVLFIPEIAFELLVKRQIVKLLEPSLRCVDLVHKEMQRMVHDCEADTRREMGRFPKLCERIIEAVSSVLCSRIPVTNQMVESLISIQLAYINTKHPDFDGATLESLLYCQTEENSCDEQVPCSTVPEDHRTGKSSADQMNSQSIESLPESVDKKEIADAASSSVPKQSSSSDGPTHGYPFGQSNLAQRATNAFSDFFLRRKEDKEEPSSKPKQPVVEKCLLSSREQRDCRIIERLVQSYFAIVRTQVQDTIPKTIMHFLVNHVKDNLQSELVKQLYHPEMLDDLLEESEHVKKQREGIMKTLDSLQKASQIIGEVRELRLS
ncbi:dynamin 1 protein [Trichuris trichiura]|uniref:Dynamin 1 protein n=1 Tax=Trichuris trichiura TaxID=36087 RepID=A0A077YYG1_TRITR|nr:dynamin 1 protein [Trichuris trichiura]